MKLSAFHLGNEWNIIIFCKNLNLKTSICILFEFQKVK